MVLANLTHDIICTHALTQVLLNPLQVALADNCHLTRNTQAILTGAGFSQLSLQHENLAGVGSLLSPHVRGIATKL
jgi:hypothetical protein